MTVACEIIGKFPNQNYLTTMKKMLEKGLLSDEKIQEIVTW